MGRRTNIYRRTGVASTAFRVHWIIKHLDFSRPHTSLHCVNPPQNPDLVDVDLLPSVRLFVCVLYVIVCLHVCVCVCACSVQNVACPTEPVTGRIL